MKHLLLISLALLLNACVEVTDVEEEKLQQMGAPASEAEFIVGEQANDYQVLLALPEGTQAVIRRDLNALDGNPSAVPILLNQGKLVDQSPQPGSSYEYEFGYMAGGVFHTVKTVKVKVPKDLMVDGILEMSADQARISNDYARLFLSEGSILRTNGNKVIFKVKELVSYNATIESFPENATATVGVAGRRGGDLEIYAQNVIGTLRISMRGENGGDGLPGAKYDKPAKSGGIGFGCGPGGSGANGIKGQDGARGARGGNSGTLKIVVPQENQISFVVDKIPGEGGKGGAGGPGQLGGVGGTTTNCPFANFGPKGADGPPGNPGPLGPDGQIE